MPAYIIVEIEIHDPETYEEYKKLTPVSLAAYGGKFIVRGGKQKHWKVAGNRSGLSCWNSRRWKEQRNGGLRKNMPLLKTCASVRHIPR